MIAPLRARHRAVFAVLAVALPAAFAWALLERDDEREPEALPPAIADDGPVLGEARAAFVAVHDGREMRVTLGSANVVAVEHKSGEPAPDVLVYWCPHAPQVDELPPGSVLLGALGLRERRFALPDDARTEPGVIALFSLAHFEVVASVALGT